jgi:hypothetical protein
MAEETVVSPPRAQQLLAKTMADALMTMPLEDIHRLVTVRDGKMSSFNHGLFAKHVVPLASNHGLKLEVID